MRIGFIGAGKVGFTFGRYIAEKRELVREKTDGALCLEVGGYFSASRQSAELAAELPRPVCTTAWSSCVSIVKLFFSPFLTDR